MKSTLIFKFSQMLEWENSDSIDIYKVGIYSNDTILIGSIKRLAESNTLHSKPIEVYTYSEIDDVRQLQCIFIDFSYRKFIRKVNSDIGNMPVLFITYNAPVPEMSMINIYKSKSTSTLKFNINRDRLDNSSFLYTNKLLLFGGNVDDVKELYVEANRELQMKNMEIDSINTRLTDLKIESRLYQRQVNYMDRKVSKLTLQIRSKEEEAMKKDSDLQLLNTKLIYQQKQSEHLKNVLQNKIDSTSLVEAKLEQLNNELIEKKQLVYNNEKEIARQVKYIESQQRVLLYAVVMGIALLLAVISFIIAFRAKHALTSKLKQLVDERTEELNKSRIYYKSLFQNTPVGICEFDFSQVIKNVRNFEDDNNNHISNVSKQIILKALKKIRINDANRYTLDLFNASNNEEFIANSIGLFGDESVAGLRVLFKNLVRGKEQFEHEIILKTPDGGKLHLMQRVIVLPEDKEIYSKVIVSMLDITKLKMYEHELVQHRNHLEELVEKRSKEIVKLNKNLNKKNVELAGSNKQLKEQQEEILSTLEQLNKTQTQLVENEKLASLGMLTAGIAHEINNPINFISSGNQALEVIFNDLYLLLNKIVSESESYSSDDISKIKELTKQIEEEKYSTIIKEIIQNIQMGVERVVAIINSLQAYTRSSDVPEPYNIETGLENSLVILNNRYKNRIVIQKNYKNVPQVICVAGKLEQAFINILSNAFDAIEGEGTVTITTEFDKKEKSVIVTFKDTGDGISDEDICKVFDPFFTTKESGKGTGLGLYITYSIIQQLNGTVIVKSEKNSGTTFKITLPV